MVEPFGPGHKFILRHSPHAECYDIDKSEFGKLFVIEYYTGEYDGDGPRQHEYIATRAGGPKESWYVLHDMIEPAEGPW